MAPRHVDASRDFYFTFSERAALGRRGGGEVMCAAILSLFVLISPFSRP